MLTIVICYIAVYDPTRDPFASNYKVYQGLHSPNLVDEIMLRWTRPCYSIQFPLYFKGGNKNLSKRIMLTRCLLRIIIGLALLVFYSIGSAELYVGFH